MPDLVNQQLVAVIQCGKFPNLGISIVPPEFCFSGLGPGFPNPGNLFGPVKPFLVHLYLKTERCLRLKLCNR